MSSSVFFGMSTLAYVVAMIAYLGFLVFKKRGIGQAATTLTVAGFVLQTLAFVRRWQEFHALNVSLGHEVSILRSAPLTNLYESLIFFVWCLILGYLVVEFKYKNRTFGAFVTPVAAITLAFIDLYGISKDISPLVPALQSNWLLVHVFLSFVSYATFAIAFSTGTMYLISTTEDRTESSYLFWTVTIGIFASVLLAMGIDSLVFALQGRPLMPRGENPLLINTFRSGNPLLVGLSLLGTGSVVFLFWRYGHVLRRIISSLNISAEMLDDVTYKSIAVGFPVFTLGGLIFGAVWADQAWGVYWSWDPKETWSLITWFVYAFYLHARFLRGWKGHKTAVIAMLGFVAVVFTYLGVNLLLSGLHAYGSQ